MFPTPIYFQGSSQRDYEKNSGKCLTYYASQKHLAIMTDGSITNRRLMRSKASINKGGGYCPMAFFKVSFPPTTGNVSRVDDKSTVISVPGSGQSVYSLSLA